MKPRIVIDDFSYGITSDPTIPAKNGFSFCNGLDIYADYGKLQASQAITKGTKAAGLPAGEVYWLETYTKDTSIPYWSYAINGYIYGRISSTWHKLHQNVQTITNYGGFKAFGNTLFYASDAYLGGTVESQLTIAATNNTTEIHIKSGNVFPNSGDLVLRNESITYTGKTFYSGSAGTAILTGLSRAQNGTTATTGTVNTVVLGFHDSLRTFTAQDNMWHPMQEFNAKLNVGDGRYITTLDGDGAFTASALTLPKDYRTSSLDVFNDSLVIGTFIGSDIGDYPKTQLFMWNGISELPDQFVDLNEGGITALKSWKNNIIVFAGKRGNIYSSNGSSIDKLKIIPKVPTTGSPIVYPGSPSIVAGDLLFGLSGTRTTDGELGIYSLGQKSIGDPISLTLRYVSTSGVLTTGNNRTTAIMPFGNTGQFFVGQTDSIPEDNYQIGYLDTSNKILSGTYWESQVYEIMADDKPDILRGVELVCDKMSNGTINIKYKVDDASSWSTLGEIDSQNQDKVFYGISDRGKTIQLRLEFECLSNTSPKVKTIKIY